MNELTDDFKDLLVELVDAGARFVVLGGFAVAAHGHPRTTKDLDVLVHATPENAARVFRALVRFGAPIETFDIKPDDFSAYDGTLQIGVAPNRVDILTRADGIRFDEALEDCIELSVRGRSVPIIGRAALLKNKRAAGRPRDLQDVEALESQD